MKLGPHERAHVPLPITLFLRKTVDSGSVVSVYGRAEPALGALHGARARDL